jgi:hypothetical protein
VTVIAMLLIKSDYQISAAGRPSSSPWSISPAARPGDQGPGRDKDLGGTDGTTLTAELTS